MKIAGGENPNHGVARPRNRAHGAEERNKSRSIKWAAKQNKFRPEGDVFFLDFSFYRTYQALKIVETIATSQNGTSGELGRIYLSGLDDTRRWPSRAAKQNTSINA
jgi:hypothetical protein